MDFPNAPFGLNAFGRLAFGVTSELYTTSTWLAAYKGEDDTQNISIDGDICNLMPKGTISATSNHSTTVYAKTANNGYQAYEANTPVWTGSRVDLDPDKLWWSATTTAATPDPIVNARLVFNDGSTHREKYTETDGSVWIGESLASGVNAAYRPGDGATIDVYAGNAGSLTQVYFHGMGLSGSAPDFSDSPALTHVYFNGTGLSGIAPDFSNNPALQNVYFGSNDLSGDVPGFSNNPVIKIVGFYDNQLIGFAGGWPATAFEFRLDGNALTEAAVNLILTEADTYGIATGTTINLTGGTNAAPTGAGITAKNNLISNGAVVTTN